jgi:hypothetical protein
VTLKVKLIAVVAIVWFIDSVKASTGAILKYNVNFHLRMIAGGNNNNHIQMRDSVFLARIGFYPALYETVVLRIN